jgi:tRNA (cmo5U34)-methyltransferase
MRDTAQARLTRFGGRAAVAPFDLLRDDWLSQLDGADLVWASLSVHHRDGPGKQALFRAVAQRTSDRAAFLLADVVEPPNGPARALFADVYDHIAETQSLTQTGGPDAFDAFVREQWNCYRYPDPVDIPSPLADQVAWLRDAGFAVAASFWQHAGHAVYGGFKRLDAEPPGGRLAFADALAVTRRVLGAATDPTDT